MLFIQLLLGALTGLFTARLAKQRGKNPVPWFWIGLLFGLLGLVVLLFVTRKKKAPAPAAPVAIPKAPESPSPYWYYLDAENKSIGPMSFDALFKRAPSERDLVWNEKYTEWKEWQAILAEAKATQ